MRKSESIENLAKALSKFQSEVTNPKNTQDNPFYNSKYAPLQDVLNLVRPLLSKYGLSVIQHPSGDGEHISISTVLLHESGEWIEFDPLVLKAEKVTPQGAGSAITYGRRYALSAVLGIASEDDDDANAFENNPSKQEAQRTLTDAQIKRLYAIATSAGITHEQVKKAIKKDYKKDSAKELTKQEYDELCNRLEKAKERGGVA